MKLWRWGKGRQEGGYDKFPIWVSERFRFDAYLLRFPQGSEVKRHLDPAPDGYAHHRVNFILRRPRAGGKIGVDIAPAQRDEGKEWRWGISEIVQDRIFHFRPDQYLHYMTPITEGGMLMLSVGWLRKKRP